MEIITIQARVTGKVQGVFFRDCTRRKAKELNLYGWVKNCSDGSVETIISGPSDSVNLMVKWLSYGSPLSQVKQVVVKKGMPSPDVDHFFIDY